MKRIQPLSLVVVLACGLTALAVLLAACGCQTGTTGFARPLAPGSEHAITNTVTLLTTAAGSVAPAPWGSVAEGVGAGVLGIVAAWQAWTHGRVQKLVNANNSNSAAPKI